MQEITLKFCLIFFSILARIASSQGNDELCDRQLEYFENSLKQREEWAIFGMIKLAKLANNLKHVFICQHISCYFESF